MFQLIALILIPSLSFAFTLNPNTGKGFSDNEIKIEIANTSCAGAGISTSKFKTFIEKAVDKYWNTVATSALYLKVGKVGNKDVDGIQFEDALGIASKNTILAGCNDDATDFASGNILGAAVMSCSGSTCRAVFFLNSSSTSVVDQLDDDTIIATIAHEIGHAFGLGHSEYKHSLMYYSAGGKTQKWLSEDDIDGVSYLYPHNKELMGAIGSCGTINTNTDDSDQNGFFFALLLLGALISFMPHWLYRFYYPRQRL